MPKSHEEFTRLYGLSKEKFRKIMGDMTDSVLHNRGQEMGRRKLGQAESFRPPGGILPAGPVTQDWTHSLTMMQQSVLLAAVRGPDGLAKYHPSKYLLRWYRRCILLSAMDRRVLHDPVEPNGGSFTGPSVQVTSSGSFIASGTLRNGRVHYANGDREPCDTWTAALDLWVTAYIASLDEVPHHYQLHFMHAAEIVGYKHPDELIRDWWYRTYARLVKDMHLMTEPIGGMDERLSDNRANWLKYGDEATEA